MSHRRLLERITHLINQDDDRRWKELHEELTTKYESLNHSIKQTQALAREYKEAQKNIGPLATAAWKKKKI